MSEQVRHRIHVRPTDAHPDRETDTRPQCPSARPDMPGSHILGLVRGTVENPRVAFLDRLEPVSDELLALAEPVAPTEVFRFAAPCVADACEHFDGRDCRLATRVVQRLPEAVDEVPDCMLRAGCRWWSQEGDAACLRCPMVLTESYGASEYAEEMRVAADPKTPV